MSDAIKMLKQLKTGLKQLKTARIALDHLSGELISKLPEGKREEASKLLIKAKRGNMDVSEFMVFAGNMRKDDKEEIKNGAKRVDEKKNNVEGNG